MSASCERPAFSPLMLPDPWLSHVRPAVAAELDGKEIPAGSFVDLTEGQEIVFEDGSRYTVRIDGKVHQQSIEDSSAWAIRDNPVPERASRPDATILALHPSLRHTEAIFRPHQVHPRLLSPDVGSSQQVLLVAQSDACWLVT